MAGWFNKADKTDELEQTLHQFQCVLDNSDNLIMLCDTSPDNAIFYMNKTARDVLSQHQAELNQRFRSGVDVKQAQGKTIHQFHRDPSHNRKILADLAARKMPFHSAMIPVGGIVFMTKVFPIWSKQDSGKLLCFMASFKDVTAEETARQLKEEHDSRRTFLENRVNEVSENMQAMSATIENVAVQTSSASQSAELMLSESRKSAKIVNETSSGMKSVGEMVRATADSLVSLGQRSETIGRIINVIKDIADQTNLLALNAAIEAARAGEMGRGFAVVADEVRKLAERTTKATQEISDMIHTIQSEVQQNVQAIENGRDKVDSTENDFLRAEEALTAIVREVNNMRDFVVQIANAAEEQAATSQDIADKLTEIARGQ
ncbi:methyl-accepting chemotaxis protein [Chromobacterium sp. IIBBL 290-4]|uniref:methyl-accepting chemotaxis protein n=1 Tax=Chromobacterium sp. IIBBL 290-4 TaxID=2953890 RepID=UPI0020B6C231|nr:methyl-accepting chemotaxis protein [Chromobacterium sp. IIBBL 290-4]UTH74170.1 methyl-accepting chemotaxis protein [Chromobacterium sp. IIBBL 290-4]